MEKKIRKLERIILADALYGNFKRLMKVASEHLDIVQMKLVLLRQDIKDVLRFFVTEAATYMLQQNINNTLYTKLFPSFNSSITKYYYCIHFCK